MQTHAEVLIIIRLVHIAIPLQLTPKDCEVGLPRLMRRPTSQDLATDIISGSYRALAV